MGGLPFLRSTRLGKTEWLFISPQWWIVTHAKSIVKAH
jgi:hypothetical protein